MKILRTIIAAAVITTALATPQRVQSQGTLPDEPRPNAWRLVYAADSLGAQTAGSKEALLRAVRAGQPIRIGWEVSWRAADGTTGVLAHAAPAAFLTIHQNEVFAQIAPILGQSPRAREPVIEFRIAPAQPWYGLFDTRGWLRGYFVGSDSASSSRFAIRWYTSG